MARIVYAWSESFPRSQDPNKVGRELEEIRRESEDGRLTPEAVVERAKDRRSELHSMFEWDDKRAAERFRLSQARTIIHSIRVLKNTGGAQQVQRLYVHVRKDESAERGYVTIRQASSDEELARQVRVRATQDLRGWLSRYEELTDRIPSEAFERVRGAVEALQAVDAIEFEPAAE